MRFRRIVFLFLLVLLPELLWAGRVRLKVADIYERGASKVYVIEGSPYQVIRRRLSSSMHREPFHYFIDDGKVSFKGGTEIGMLKGGVELQFKSNDPFINSLHRFVGPKYVHVDSISSLDKASDIYKGPGAGQALYAALRHDFPDLPIVGKIQSKQILRAVRQQFIRHPLIPNFDLPIFANTPGPIRFLKLETNALGAREFQIAGPWSFTTLVRYPESVGPAGQWLDLKSMKSSEYLKAYLRSLMGQKSFYEH